MSKYFFQMPFGFEQLYTNNNTINFYIKMFSELDLSSIEEFPHKYKKTTSHAGCKPVSYHCLFRAFVVMKTQRLAYVSDLLDYLENNLAVAIVCGFSLGKLPAKDAFYRFIKNITNDELSKVMSSCVSKLVDLDLVDFKDILIDSTPIHANTKLNNLKSFAKNKLDKNNQPKSDSDCKLGVHSASNDSTNKDYEFFWGYKDHILVDAKSGLPIFNLTLPANAHDLRAAEALIPKAQDYLCFKGKIQHLIADKGYDSNSFYELIKKEFAASVIAPLKKNSKTALFDGDIPTCEARLTMHKDGHSYRSTSIRFKFCCPFKNSKSKFCPCNHPKFNKTSKNKGCIKWMCVKSANLRNSLDRSSPFFKSLYSKRTAIERYNSRFKFLSNEQAYVRNINSVSNIISISHICLQLTAIVSAKLEKLELIRSLAVLKKLA